MNQQRILITGGAGFIGTQVSYALFEAGYDITIVDKTIRNINIPGKLINSDYMSYLESTTDKFETIIHLAADHIVPQSLDDPSRYYTNNVVKMKSLLDYMVSSNTKNIVFSSTGNLYGRQGLSGKLTEDLYTDPQNPYASSKVVGELLLRDYAAAYGLRYVNFRYFNAVGADPLCRFGYMQEPPTHILPVLSEKLISGDTFEIYGSDYDTTDGTCIRDYVHVSDIADAHILALEFLKSSSTNETFNLGGGSTGISILDLLKYAAEVVGIEPKVVYSARRNGDPARLVADISKAKRLMGWSPKYNIKDAIQHSYDWKYKYETSK